MNDGQSMRELHQPLILSKVEVHPIEPHDKRRWDQLMKEHHYLGLRVLAGESLRYVAAIDSQWVALIGWNTGAFKCHVRDAFIGWSRIIQRQRLHLIANNARFLILPDFHIYNLASRVLGLNLRRLSRDWEAMYGHSIYLAETFVDPGRFTGACYKAANFTCLGATLGFGKCNSRYYYHGRNKAVFIRPLCTNAVGLLRAPESIPPQRKVNAMPFTHKQIEELMSTLRKLPDPRHKKGQRHRLVSVLAISICAVLCGAKSFNSIAEWASHRSQNHLERLWARYREKEKRYSPPSEPTIRRILQAIDPGCVDHGIYGWLQSVAQGDSIAIDGKTLKGALNEDGSRTHLLSAVLHQGGISIAQQSVSQKTNEIPVARELLKNMPIEGKIITADALHTQKETAELIVRDKQADYCFIVKDNQASLKEDIAFEFQKDFPPSVRNRR